MEKTAMGLRRNKGFSDSSKLIAAYLANKESEMEKMVCYM